MLRLLSAALAAILITLPSIAALAAEKEGGPDDRSWQSLHSVVSYRGVRVNLVQPPAPADAEPAPDAAKIAAPEAAEVAARQAAEVPDPVEPDLPDTDLAVPATPVPATPAPAEQERLSPADDTTAAPAVVPSPDACGPVRAQIGDLAIPSDAPLVVDVSAPDAAPVPDEIPLPDAIPVPGDIRPVKDTFAQKDADGKGGKSGGLFGRGRGAAGGADGRCSTCGGLRGRRAGGGDGCGGCGSGGLLGRDAGSNWCWCEMSPHYAYFPEMHGHYYFRPYNWSKIAEQQQTSTEWGQDPRNPWGHQVFDQVYAEYQAEKQAAPNDTADPFVESGDAVVPLPPED